MKKVVNPVGMFVIGLLLGIISRLFDIYFQNLGNMFSQMSIWILLGVIISIYSSSKKSNVKYFTILSRNAYNVLFCGFYN